MKRHTQKWFLDRVNKFIYNQNGLKINVLDREHAYYLYNVQNEEGYSYMDKNIFELNILDIMNDICVESCAPQYFEKWKDVEKQIKKTRRLNN